MNNPQYVCAPCGEAARKQAGLAPLPSPQVHTWHQGLCDDCQRTTSVTGVRNFGYPYSKPTIHPKLTAADVQHWT